MPVASHIQVANVTNVFEKLYSKSEVPAFHVFSDTEARDVLWHSGSQPGSRRALHSGSELTLSVD